jgi:3-deoxy-D-manno-octulosonic-acid transferase
VVFGPHTWNFRDTAERLLACDGAIRVADGAELERVVDELIGDETARRRLGTAAREFVQRQQGATAATLDLLDGLIEGEPGKERHPWKASA